MRVESSHWRDYAACFRPHLGLLAGITLAGLVQSFAYVPMAGLLKWIFDDVLGPRGNGRLGLAMGGLLAVQLGSLGLAYWIRIKALRVNHDVLSRLRMASLERLYQLPRSFYTGVDMDHLHVTLVHETTYIDAMNNALTVQFLPSGLSALVLFAILFWIDPKYALIIAVAAPAIFVGNRLMTRQAWFHQEGLRRAFEDFSRRVRFAITSMELTRAQAAEATELRRQAGSVQELRRVSLDLNRFDAVQQLAQGGILLSATLLVLIAGGYSLAQGKHQPRPDDGVLRGGGAISRTQALRHGRGRSPKSAWACAPFANWTTSCRIRIASPTREPVNSRPSAKSGCSRSPSRTAPDPRF